MVMKLILSVIYSTFLPVCLGFLSESEYPYLFTIVLNKGYVPGQKEMRVCTSIELVENEFYLLPKTCFDNPERNLELRAALIQRKVLKFTPLIYETFVLRWETFSQFIILEKDQDIDVEVIVGRKSPISDDPADFNATNQANEKRQVKKINLTPSPELMAKMKPDETMNNPIGRKPLNKKTFDEPQLHLPPFLEDEANLPPRVLLTVPNSPLLTDCYTLGWGSFISKRKSFKELEGSKLDKVRIVSIQPGTKDPVTGFFFSEVWIEREKNEKLVEDIGSPLVCRVKNHGDLEVIIGMFMGGNDSFNHEIDYYRSFMGEFYYITHWAIGTNVSITGDPVSWTLWPVEYDEEPRSRGVVLNFDNMLFYSSVLVFYCVT